MDTPELVALVWRERQIREPTETGELQAVVSPFLCMLIRDRNIHPVKISLFLQDHPEILDEYKEVCSVLSRFVEKFMKSREDSDDSAMHYYFISSVIKLAAEAREKDKEHSLNTWLKTLMKGREEDGFLEFQERLIRKTIMEFPYASCALVHLLRQIASVKIGNEPTALSLLLASINGQQFAREVAGGCYTCGEPETKSKCTRCKMVVYCNQECQLLHWPTHETFCDKLLAEQFRKQEERRKKEDEKQREEEEKRRQEEEHRKKGKESQHGDEDTSKVETSLDVAHTEDLDKADTVAWWNKDQYRMQEEKRKKKKEKQREEGEKRRQKEEKRKKEEESQHGDEDKSKVETSSEIAHTHGPWKAEYSYEKEVDLQGKYMKCTKNPGHKNFIPVDKFSLEDLPEGYRDPEIVSYIRAVSVLTVLVTVKKPATVPGTDQPYQDYANRSLRGKRATGWVDDVAIYSDFKGKTCECKDCRNSSTPETKFAVISIFTAKHVVSKSHGVEGTTCHLFFDRGNTLATCRGVVTLIGMVPYDCDSEKDQYVMKHFTHNLDLAHILQGAWTRSDVLSCNIRKTLPLIAQYKPNMDVADKQPLSFMVSHPHGCSKHITIGHWTSVHIPETLEIIYEYTTATCGGSSGARWVMPHPYSSFIVDMTCRRATHRGISHGVNHFIELDDEILPSNLDKIKEYRRFVSAMGSGRQYPILEATGDSYKREKSEAAIRLYSVSELIGALVTVMYKVLVFVLIACGVWPFVVPDHLLPWSRR